MNARSIVRFLVPIVVAAVLGPLVVSVSFWLFNVASDLFDAALPVSFSDELGVLAFDTIMAYLIGGPIALLAGLLVSLCIIWRPPSALVVNAAAVIATVAFMAVAATGLLGPAEENNGRSNFLFMLIAAVFAANVCWFLVRPFLRPSEVR